MKKYIVKWYITGCVKAVDGYHCGELTKEFKFDSYDHAIEFVMELVERTSDSSIKVEITKEVK